ncbi:inactive protein kinase SELMODRAFT_444075 isoform X2 [Sesamum indicum]|uniref:non-specific serine/threonine protein kinase n=1 Tax=Sesamum indicum TaxID=4182 RepID=A0A6I9SV75_SESIN|nr:inactive protein kinase SELMODRAFT_444075 isoform X2 [Sesamum indicum]
MFPPKSEATIPHGGGAADKVVVAVKAEKVISKAALAWALTHAACSGDGITLLAIFSGNKGGGRRFLGIPRLKGNCRSFDPAKLPERICQISESCSQMVLQLQDRIQVRVRIKVVSAMSAGAVAAEAKSYAANWVILDKKLKREMKHCMNELHCNIVVMKGAQPKVLRLNLARSNDLQTPFYSAASSPTKDSNKFYTHIMKHTTPVSSPEDPNTSYTRTSGENSLSSPDTGSCIYVVYEENPLYEGLSRGKSLPSRLETPDHPGARRMCFSGTPESETLRNHRNHADNEHGPGSGNQNNISRTSSTFARTEMFDLIQYRDDEMVGGTELDKKSDGDCVYNSSIRGAVSLGKTSLLPPPLCTHCKSKAPAFGKPPKQFNYRELEEATDYFSDKNFVAEGGFGLVHRGILRNGLVIAVKQLKFAGPQRDADFCREVRVLSCAQHRNVVLLIGYCIERKKRLLVYEYICNRSLDFHLHVAGNEKSVLDWQARLKIAVGTARGLRYLHEDCRVGCIVHRNLRPNNILLTHDFEPLVADFGLARLHSEEEFCDSNQEVGTPGYLAPEYFSGGKMTEKVDIYAFGLVLLELITGPRAHDLQCCSAYQILLDHIHALAKMEPLHILAYNHQLLDPHLASNQLQVLPYELHAMGCAASLCLQQDPDLRPPMSKVVKMLEGGSPVTPLALDLCIVGCSNGHSHDKLRQ